ncbi:putative odorant-binding protein A5 [Pieris rapae]|uniref:putative odorant-binding protein A5 n=1 Tax=Pieris rapae TaxID=64459 RepID=UPI001E27EB19|nr:putative odorant-binding protein A5 [Pieris rapae]
MLLLLFLIAIHGTIGDRDRNRECTCIENYLKAEKTNLSVSEAFEKYDITPKYLPDPPEYLLEGNLLSADVHLGNFVPPIRTGEPEIKYSKGKNNVYYTIFIIDIDGPGSSPSKSYIVSLNINVPKSENNLILSGDSLVPLSAPMVNLGSGIHRIVGLLYEQKGRINPEKRELYELARTRSINLSNFTKKYRLMDPVAGNFYRTELDHCEKAENEGLIDDVNE